MSSHELQNLTVRDIICSPNHKHFNILIPLFDCLHVFLSENQGVFKMFNSNLHTYTKRGIIENDCGCEDGDDVFCLQTLSNE